MATRRPFNLAQTGFSIGPMTPPYLPPSMQQGQQQAPMGATPDFGRQARAYALQDVLSQPIQVESGSAAEAIAEALAGGLRGRAARTERQAALEQQQAAQTRAEVLAQQQADREYKGDIQDRDYRAQVLAADTDYHNRSLTQDQQQFEQSQETTRRGQDISARNAASGGADAGAYRVMTSQEVQARGLPPGSYQLNTRTNQVTPIGRVRSQYTEFAGQSAQFASRMAAADQTLRELETAVDPALVYGSAWGGGSTEVRRIRQAQREFVNAVLRRESGAAIQPSEFESARQQYFPVPGDTPEVIEQKRQARERSIVGLVNASQGAYEEWYGGEQQQQPAQQETPSGANRRQRGPIGAAPSAVIRYDAQGRRIP